MNTIRTFISIDMPAEYKPVVKEVQNKLRASGADVKWERPEKLHLTLKFLGDVKENILPSVISSVEEAVVQYHSFDLTLGGIGSFPKRKPPRIIWVGCKNDNKTLETLKTALDDELLSFGFKRDENKFTPHITIGRVRTETNLSNLISMLETVTLQSGTFSIHEVLVMKSMLKSSGSEYEILKKIELQGK